MIDTLELIGLATDELRRRNIWDVLVSEKVMTFMEDTFNDDVGLDLYYEKYPVRGKLNGKAVTYLGVRFFENKEDYERANSTK